MTRTERANSLLERLGSPLRVEPGLTNVEDVILAALEAIEVRLAGIDAYLQHRVGSDREREWNYLSALAGLTPEGNAAEPVLPLVKRSDG